MKSMVRIMRLFIFAALVSMFLSKELHAQSSCAHEKARFKCLGFVKNFEQKVEEMKQGKSIEELLLLPYYELKEYGNKWVIYERYAIGKAKVASCSDSDYLSECNKNTGSSPASSAYSSCGSGDLRDAVEEIHEFVNRLHGKLQKESQEVMIVINLLPDSDFKDLLLGLASEIATTVYKVEGEVGGYVSGGSGKIAQLYQQLVPISRAILKEYDEWGYAITPFLSEKDQKHVQRAVKVMRSIATGGCL